MNDKLERKPGMGEGYCQHGNLVGNRRECCNEILVESSNSLVRDDAEAHERRGVPKEAVLIALLEDGLTRIEDTPVEQFGDESPHRGLEFTTGDMLQIAMTQRIRMLLSSKKREVASMDRVSPEQAEAFEKLNSYILSKQEEYERQYSHVPMKQQELLGQLSFMYIQGYKMIFGSES